MNKRRFVKLKLSFDYRFAMAIACAAVGTFCLLKYFEPAEAKEYQISGKLSISSINLNSDVTSLALENGELNTPDSIIGSFSRHKNSTLLIGHSNTAFSELKNIRIGDTVQYNNNSYRIYKSQIIEKSSINMKDLLSEKDTDTIILMTCFGEMYANGDASHRLIIFASLV